MQPNALSSIMDTLEKLAKRVRHLEAISMSGTASSTGYLQIQDEGVDLTRRNILNFIGVTVEATDDPINVRTDVTITAASTVTRELVYLMSGMLGTTTGPLHIPNKIGALTITKVALTVGNAPAGADIIVDVHKEGTTIFTNQAHRPRVVAGATTGETTDIDVSAWALDESVTFDIDQVGTTTPGANLCIAVVCV